jgi:hypothetical protein
VSNATFSESCTMAMFNVICLGILFSGIIVLIYVEAVSEEYLQLDLAQFLLLFTHSFVIKFTDKIYVTS